MNTCKEAFNPIIDALLEIMTFHGVVIRRWSGDENHVS